MSLARFRTPLIASLALVIGAATAASARADSKRGFRQLTSVHPVAVQRGKSPQVKVRCNFTLDGAYRTFFDRPGITMTYAETAPIDAYTKSRGSPGVPFRFDVKVPETQEPRIYEFRVATPVAVSSAAAMLVTELPVVVEEEKENGTAAAAQAVALPAAICGVCEKFEDVDCYRIPGRAGQELTMNVFAQRVTDTIHSMVVKGPRIYLMDAIVTLYGPNGQVVGQNDNFLGGDPFLACRLPVDGDYVLEVRDARYAGDPRYSYCVEVSDHPVAHAVFPPAVQRGTTVAATMIGHNLGRESPAVTISGDADDPEGWTTPRFSMPSGQTNAVPVLVSPHPQSIAGVNNVSRETALPLTLPCGVSGRFTQPDETHYLSFAATKGKIYRFETTASRIALATDTVLEVYDATGKLVAEADDGQQTKDAKLLFTAPSDGTYFVSVRDLHARAGDRYLYHLQAEEASPDFELSGEYSYGQLGPGTSTIWFVKVERIAGFAGPVSIEVEGLPEGVTFTPVTVPPHMTQAGLILTAAADAKVNAALVRVVGKATIAGPDGQPREVVHAGRITTEQQSSGGGQARWPIRTQIVGVTQPGDLTRVTAEPADLTLTPGGKAEIKVRIERNPDFEDPVTLSMTFDYFTTVFGAQLPPGVQVGKDSQARLAGNTLEGKIILEAAANAAPLDKLPIGVMARVPVSFSINNNYSTNPVFLTIAK